MKKLFFIILGLIALGSFNSCKKEVPKIVGCMDPASSSYNPKATIDNGACVYEGRVVVYLTKTKKVGRVVVKVNGDSLGVITKPSTQMPDCHNITDNTEEAVLVKKILKGKFGGYDLTASDDSGNVWKGTLNMKAGQCFSYELP